MLATYAQSGHPWVAATAKAWLSQLDVLVPAVDADTVWNDVPDDPPSFELALRARVAWLAHHLDRMTLERDLVQSSGGGIWVLRVWKDTAVANLRVQVEVQEGMTAYDGRHDPRPPYRDRLKGPAPVVSLRLSDVDTSEEFDWDLLHRVFTENVLDSNGNPLPDWPWQLTPANPRHPLDRAAWIAMVKAGGPKWLGKGFGMALATNAALPGMLIRCADAARVDYDPRGDSQRPPAFGAVVCRHVGHSERVVELASPSERLARSMNSRSCRQSTLGPRPTPPIGGSDGTDSQARDLCDGRQVVLESA